MQIEHAITVQAPAERIYALYEDVAHWNRWDPDTRASGIDGPFEVGTRGFLTPARGRTVPIQLTEVIANRSFTVEARIPLFRMVFEHVLLAQPGGATRVVHRVTFTGPLTFILGRLVGAQVDAGLPVTLARLKAMAEQAR